MIGDNISEEAFAEQYRSFIEETEEEARHSSYWFSVAAGYQRTGFLTIHDAMKQADEKMYADKAIMKQENRQREVR